MCCYIHPYDKQLQKRYRVKSETQEIALEAIEYMKLDRQTRVLKVSTFPLIDTTLLDLARTFGSNIPFVTPKTAYLNYLSPRTTRIIIHLHYAPRRGNFGIIEGIEHRALCKMNSMAIGY